MDFFEIKVNHTRQTGEDNPASVSETYLVEETILVEAESIQKAVSALSESLNNLDCDIVSVKKSKILGVYRAV